MFVDAIDVSRNVTATMFSPKLSIIILNKLLNNLIVNTLAMHKIYEIFNQKV